MRRREFMLIAAGAALWPVETTPQQARVRRVGLLTLSNPDAYWNLLRDAFRDAGYIDGKNIQLDFRSGDGKRELLEAHAAELVRAKVDLIVAVLTPAVQAAKQATKEVPVVMIAGAPVESGLVPSLSRPGANVTGVSTTGADLAAKTLDVLREMLPSLHRISVLINADDLGFGKPMLAQIQSASRSLAIDVQPLIVRPPSELHTAFASMLKNRSQAALVQASLPRALVIELALKHRIPTIAPNTAWVEAGALMAYAPDLRDVCRKAAGYADRIFKGSRPAELPIQQPTQFELLINQKTAHAIDLTVPQSVLLRANRVIE